MRLEADEKKRQGAFELAQDILASTGVRPKPKEEQPKKVEPTILDAVYGVVSSMTHGK